MTPRMSSESSRADIAVDPTRLQNITVTWMGEHVTEETRGFLQRGSEALPRNSRCRASAAVPDRPRYGRSAPTPIVPETSCERVGSTQAAVLPMARCCGPPARPLDIKAGGLSRLICQAGINGDACTIHHFGQLSASAAGRRSLAGNANELGKYAGVTGICREGRLTGEKR